MARTIRTSSTHRSQGFAPFELLLSIIAVVVVMGGGWYIWAQRSRNSGHQMTHLPSTIHNKQTVPAAPPRDPYKGWKTYENKAGHFSIKYPADWAFITDESGAPDLVSPTNLKIHLYTDYGGKGGGCEPATTDKPFTAGNNCPTIEFLSAEPLQGSRLYYKDSSANYTVKQAQVLLMTSHYMETDGQSTYSIGISESTAEPFPLNTPTMGAVVPMPWLTVYSSSGDFGPYIYVHSESSSPDFLDNDDGAMVKKILRTFVVDAG